VELAVSDSYAVDTHVKVVIAWHGGLHLVAGYSGLMCIAAQKVNSAKYASLIAGLKSFIKWLTLPDGQICDVADATGKLWRSKLDETTEGGFLVLPIAIALLAGAGS